MSAIETIICLILLLMAVPDACRKFGRPALANVCFVVFGLVLGPMVEEDVATMVIHRRWLKTGGAREPTCCFVQISRWPRSQRPRR